MTIRYLLGTALIAAAASVTQAQSTPDAVRLTASADSKLWIEGTSSLHGWSCKATSLDVAIDMDPSYASATDVAAAARLVRSVRVRVPVDKLDCGNGKMNDIMRDALKAKSSPDIGYVLGRFEVAPGSAADSARIDAGGELTIAGVTRPARMTIAVGHMPDGTVRSTATVPVLMTDFGVKPPTAFFGTLRTGNRVLVKFDVLVAPPTPGAR